MFHRVDVSSSCIHISSRDYGLALQEFWRHRAWSSISVHIIGFIPEWEVYLYKIQGSDQRIGLEWGDYLRRYVICLSATVPRRGSTGISLSQRYQRIVQLTNSCTQWRACGKPKPSSHDKSPLSKLYMMRYPRFHWPHRLYGLGVNTHCEHVSLFLIKKVILSVQVAWSQLQRIAVSPSKRIHLIMTDSAISTIVPTSVPHSTWIPPVFWFAQTNNVSSRSTSIS